MENEIMGGGVAHDQTFVPNALGLLSSKISHASMGLKMLAARAKELAALPPSKPGGINTYYPFLHG